MSSFIQIQSVLYKNEKSGLRRAADNLVNALRVDGGKHIAQATLIWGDASPEPLFDQSDIDELNARYQGRMKIRYVYFHENTGTAKGHNRMAEMDNADHIMVMNPDVVVNPRIFAQLMQPFEHEKVGMTEARQTPIEHHKEYDVKTGETSWASTACAVISRTAFDKVNGFDEKTFFMYCDDLDFSWMIRLAGYQVIYVPAAVVFHDKALSSDGKWQPTQAERYYSAEAALLMAYKWSNHERVRMLLEQFGNSGDEIGLKVVAEFRRREREGLLPEPLDPQHRIAEFVGDQYGHSRFGG